MNKIPTQVKQSKQVSVPKSIIFGRVLLIFAAVGFFLMAIYLPIDFIIDNLNKTIRWTDPLHCFIGVAIIPLAVFMIFAGIAAISYVRDEGPFLSFAALSAILCAVICFVDLVITTFIAINTKNGLEFTIRFFTIVVPCFLYFLGWLLAKNWLD
ncbi:MAG: hypothetical protein SPL00_05375 [Bacilli bacterium]|nr:hypothetical protein [Bacilli bacterium]